MLIYFHAHALQLFGAAIYPHSAKWSQKFRLRVGYKYFKVPFGLSKCVRVGRR